MKERSFASPFASRSLSCSSCCTRCCSGISLTTFHNWASTAFCDPAQKAQKGRSWGRLHRVRLRMLLWTYHNWASSSEGSEGSCKDLGCEGGPGGVDQYLCRYNACIHSGVVDYIRIITFRPLPPCPWPRESSVFKTLQVVHIVFVWACSSGHTIIGHLARKARKGHLRRVHLSVLL